MSTDASWILTHCGVKFYPFNPTVDAVLGEDIAHALSLVNRFTGHTSRAYSVAEHSVRVSDLLVPYGPVMALTGLLHDASEAYLNDIARPIKCLPVFEAYRDAEARLEEVIFERFVLPYPPPPEVKEADTLLLVTEYRDLMPQHPDWQLSVEQGYRALPFQIEPWPAGVAKHLFLERLRALAGDNFF